MQYIICLLLGFYVILIFALDNSRAQRFIADTAENQLEVFFHTNVDIGRISIGLFNSVELHDVHLYDQDNRELLASQLIYGKIKVSSLLKGEIYLRNISILDASFKLVKESAEKPSNFKFIIDAFKTGKKKKPINLIINSLILHRCNLEYDELYIPQKAQDAFDIHHINAHDINVNLSLKKLTNDSINLRVRQFSATEQSGLNIKNIRLHMTGNREYAKIQDVLLEMPASRLKQKTITASYKFANGHLDIGTLAVKANMEDCTISTSDILPFARVLKDFDDQFHINVNADYHNKRLQLSQIDIKNDNAGIDVEGDLLFANNDNNFEILSKDIVFKVKNQNLIDIAQVLNKGKAIPFIEKLGDLDLRVDGAASMPLSSTFTLNTLQAKANMLIGSKVGEFNIKTSLNNSKINAAINSSDFNPSLTASQKHVPSNVSFDITAQSDLVEHSTPFIKRYGVGESSLECKINALQIDGRNYENITTNAAFSKGKLTLKTDCGDPSALISLVAEITMPENIIWFNTKEFAMPSEFGLLANVERLMPARLNMTNRYGNGCFSFDADIRVRNLDLKNLDHTTADVQITDFKLQNDNDNLVPFIMRNFNLRTTPQTEGNHVVIRSDFADLDYFGTLNTEKLKDITQNIFHSIKIGEFNSDRREAINDNIDKGQTLNFAFALKDTEFCNRLFNLNIHQSQPITAQGFTTYDGSHLSVSCLAPELSIGKMSLQGISIFAKSENGSFNLLGKASKALKSGEIQAEMTAVNSEGKINMDLEWDETANHHFYGKITSATEILFDNDKSRKNNLAFTTDFKPSLLCIGDSIWEFSKSQLQFRDNSLSISDFGISNSTQNISVNGNYNRASQDTILVSLTNVDLEYILALARLEVVEFGGHATGNIFVRQLPNGDPWAKAYVTVPDFKFNDADFGHADITLGWDHEKKDITLSGDIHEDDIGYTRVRGYVDPINRDLDLRTESKNTQLAFLNKYTEGIFSDISGRATGNCRIYGGFRTIEFSGHEVGNCVATIPITGVTYRVENADVDIVPDAFIIKSATVKDLYSGAGAGYGKLTHTHIKDMCYDFRLKGTNLRMYDKPREIDMPFYATANGSGDVHIFGAPHKMNADIHIKTVPGSELTYILDSPDADVSQMLTLRNGASQPQSAPSLDTVVKQRASDTSTANAELPTTDINLYFEVDVDDNSCLHLITDDKSGDVITVYGNGPIQATYHNKNGFQMYGTYNILRGTYGLNIPMLAQRKRFDILPDGKVRFSGNPTEAEVDVKAQYVVNSASLADLNIGSGFANNTTRVNCLVNIYGEVANMQFDLDFELPNCSEDEQRMVRNLIASDEDRTMQVLYLLGVGRFYAYNYTANEIGQSQSVLMMNSLLSSTLSSQLNNIIANAVGTSNWTFGTNISTGQLGWSDMEVEGLVSSRLLNDRLLLNGNFGYSERQAATTNFVGDFDMQYLITPSGTVSVKAYSETNDRYFTKSTLTTQGVGFQLKRDFTKFINLFRRKKSK